MSVKVASNRFIVSSVTGFYQHLIHRISGFEELGSYLVREAEYAQAFRRPNRIEELGIVLSNIPIKEYKLIGQYYTGWANYLRGERPREIFEKVAEQSQHYKARGLISLAVIEDHRGDYASELAYYNEALKCADNLSTKVDILRAIATVKAKEGFNKQSLQDLEQMWPLVRYGDLRVYHNYLNSLAVELGEAGRIQEAQDICKITLASPFAFAYPEWRETRQDLALRGYKSRSSVPIIRTIPVIRKVRENVLYMSEHERSEGYSPSPFDQPRGMSTIAGWKEKKMVKEPNGDEEKNVDKMTEQDMVLRLITMLTTEELTEKKIRKLLKEAFKILSEK